MFTFCDKNILILCIDNLRRLGMIEAEEMAGIGSFEAETVQRLRHGADSDPARTNVLFSRICFSCPKAIHRQVPPRRSFRSLRGRKIKTSTAANAVPAFNLK